MGQREKQRAEFSIVKTRLFATFYPQKREYIFDAFKPIMVLPELQ